jgi:hypothetical protein
LVISRALRGLSGPSVFGEKMNRKSRTFGIVVLTGAAGLFAIGMAKSATAQTTAPPATTAAATKNCSDFKTQPEAQQYFTSHGGSKSNNFDNLDPNRNGIACEGLPGTPTSATPTPVPTATTKPLPANGIFSMILAMSGLSLVEAGIGLSLLSDRIKSRGGRVPLAVLKLVAKATRQGKNEIELSNDMYIVRRTPEEIQKTDTLKPRVVREPVAALARPLSFGAPAADEWSATLALDDVDRDDTDDDWPYFTPPEV